MKRAFILNQAAIVAGAGLFVLSSAHAADPAPTPKPQDTVSSERIKRGDFLVRVGGCNDCHTPLKMGPQGPAPDMTRMLSGHPEQLKMPPAPKLPPGPWVVVASGTNTAWAGPWGTSFTANLTPDKDTGLGNWNEKTFIAAMRTGKHLGAGRPILPPMPWFNLAAQSDDDLKAVFAFLKSIPAVKNQVPEPLPPPDAKTGGAPL